MMDRTGGAARPPPTPPPAAWAQGPASFCDIGGSHDTQQDDTTRRGQRRTAAACGFSLCPSWAETAAARAGGAAAGEPRAQPAGQTADSGRGSAPWAEPRAGARAGGHRRCCCFWGLRWSSPLGPRQVGTDRDRYPSGSRAPPWARVPLASGTRGVRELCQGGGAASCLQPGRGKGRTRRCGDLLEATRRPPPECGDEN